MRNSREIVCNMTSSSGEGGDVIDSGNHIGCVGGLDGGRKLTITVIPIHYRQSTYQIDIQIKGILFTT